MSSPVTVTVYSRPGCHLCEDALAVVQRVRDDLGFGLEVVDIERDDRLLARYLERIPVVAIDGLDRFCFHVEAVALREALANLSRPS